MSREEISPDLMATLARVAFLVNAAYADAGRQLGVTPQQGQLLCMLRPGPWGFGALTEALGLAKSTTSGLVDGVAGRGFVRREAGLDNRSRTIALTATGNEVADRFYEAATGRVEAELKALDGSARLTLTELLRPVVAGRRFAAIFPQPDESAAADVRSA